MPLVTVKNLTFSILFSDFYHPSLNYLFCSFTTQLINLVPIQLLKTKTCPLFQRLYYVDFNCIVFINCTSPF